MIRRQKLPNAWAAPLQLYRSTASFVADRPDACGQVGLGQQTDEL